MIIVTNLLHFIANIKRKCSSKIVIVILLIYSIILEKTYRSEIKVYEKQIIKLLILSKKCNSHMRTTIYFSSNLTNLSKEINDNYKIILSKIKSNYNITYFTDDYKYNQYKDLLFSNGLINSNNIFGDNNLILSRNAIKLLKKNKTKMITNSFNKYYRFFGYLVFMKDNLYFNYIKMKRKYNKYFNYMPETYIYPNDKDEIIKKFSNYSLNINNLWLIKPPNKGGGKGITIFESLKNINTNRFLLTKYITNLHLINDKKYDLRVYALVTGLKPLRIYLNKEGLIRFATKNFTLNYSSFRNKYIHITNTDINIKNKDFIKPNISNIEQANTWNFYTFEKYLKRINIDFGLIKTRISDIIIKSIISIYQNLTLELNQNKLNDNNFYDLLGYDIILTKDYKPYLLEINTGPSLIIYNILEKTIKTNLLIDTLNIVGIHPYSKLNKFIKNNISKNTIIENVNNAFCELNRPRGDYELIFPLRDNINIYNRFFKNINTKENQIFWKLIKGFK